MDRWIDGWVNRWIDGWIDENHVQIVPHLSAATSL